METVALKKSRRSRLVCVLVLLLLFAALVARAPYGLDWTDEPYYSALPYRLWLGDRPFADTWEVHQLSGLISLPFLRLYMLFTGGGTTGVMLYFRYVFLAVQLLVSLYAFHVLRKKSGDIAALLAAGMLLMHAHFGVNGFSYNGMTQLFLVLSALCTFDALNNPRPRLFAGFAGAAYALSVQAYPYAVLTLPVYVLFWVRHARENVSVPAKKRLWQFFALGVFAVFAAFAVNVLARVTPAEIVANAGNLLRDPDHQSESVLRLLGSYCNATRVLFGPVFYAAAALAVYGYITHFVRNAHAKRRLTQLGFALAVAVVAAAVMWVLSYDYPSHHKLNLAAMSITLILPALFFLSDFRRSRYFLLVGLGVALSLAVQIGSNTGIRTSSGMLLAASIGAMLYLFRLLDDEVPKPYGAHAFRLVAAAVCFCQLALTMTLRITTVYRDAPLAALNTTLSDGPAKGVVTTRDNAAQYAGVLADMRAFAPADGTVLVTNLLPVAYLMTDRPPATPSAFNMTADSPWLDLYYETRPDRAPALIYAADASVGQSNDISLRGAAQLAASLGLSEQTGRAGTIFID